MLSITQNPYDHQEEEDDSPITRDIHALTPPRPTRGPHRESWDANSRRSSSLSIASSENNFTTMSREFNALVMAGSTIHTENHEPTNNNNLGRITEDINDQNSQEETNPLAIVPDNNNYVNPVQSPAGTDHGVLALTNHEIISGGDREVMISVHSVKKEEVVTKISAWQNAKIAKINNRFKREDAVINGWEGEQVQKATSWMKKVERKLDEKRAKALEKMQNDIAKARRKSEEKKASAEAKRGTKVARILEIANMMRAVGRAPAKRSFF